MCIILGLVGVFIATASIIDRIRMERFVDIFTTVFVFYLLYKITNTSSYFTVQIDSNAKTELDRACQ